MFIWNEKDINANQVAAIKEQNNVLLIACPGSGKTRTLTYKIAFELSKLESKKQFIIAITYTNRAADEIKERIELLGVETAQLWIGTIHAFCLEWILKPYHSYLEILKDGFRVINPHESEELLTQLCIPYLSKNISFYDCSYIQNTNGYSLSCSASYKHQYIHLILEKYWSILNKRRQIDFQLMLLYSFRLINENRFISNILSNLFSYLLLDEYQDTSEIQYAILLKILSASKKKLKTFIVGDPNQSIYHSLGGYPISKNELEAQSGSDFQLFSLSGNYRSSNTIINYFDFFKTFPNEIIGCGKYKDYHSKISYNKIIRRVLLEDEIIRLIKLNIEINGILPNEICIIAPQWVHLASLTRSLMVKLPNQSFDGPGMAPFARDIDNFFFKLCRIILTEPSPGMYVKRLRWSEEILEEFRYLNIDTSKLTKKILLKTCNGIYIEETDGIPYLKNFISALFKILNINLYNYESLKEHYVSFF